MKSRKRVVRIRMTDDEIETIRLVIKYIDLNLRIHSNPSDRKGEQLSVEASFLKSDIGKSLRRILSHV